ncbi:MAG: UDP-D-galactose:(glucosyl)LPS alpha,6-D-galactosyltransferase [Thermoanaerobacterium sp.]|nr:UDP-D-galactose:(glucosyl)LPS alpha,6-D-galactosyltransferase [Thermosipho sp. (in: thermotogales)]MDN5317039.1 UDP-D-galactose:(glucosyl)LPS alpha,6-D-galactosyltransferase [Thermoanaerobacterium sp.]
MNIVLISNNTFSTFGGYEKVVLSVFNQLLEKYNCDISIISVPHYNSLLNNPILEEFKKFRIYRSSDYKNRLHYSINILIKKILGKDLFINYFSIKKYLSELANADIVLVTDPLLINSVKYIIKKNQFNAKVVFWDHGSLFGYLRGKFQNIVYSKEIFKGLKSADAHLAIATEIKDFIKDINPGANVNLVYNPLPLYNGKLIQRPFSHHIFLYVGRLTDDDKNITFMLNGLSKLKNKEWSLKIIGTGKDENKLKNLANKLKISDRIEWLGFKKDPYSEIDYVTALLLTSRWEGFPMVLVEANQRGIPVISSDCKSGPKDIIIPGINGYLYKEGDISDFIRVISGVMDGRLQFDTPENIAKTAERFRDDIVISNIYNFLKK